MRHQADLVPQEALSVEHWWQMSPCPAYGLTFLRTRNPSSRSFTVRFQNTMSRTDHPCSLSAMTTNTASHQVKDPSVIKACESQWKKLDSLKTKCIVVRVVTVFMSSWLRAAKWSQLKSVSG